MTKEWFTQEFDEWNKVTGALEPGTGWYYEVRSIFIDADKEIERCHAALALCRDWYLNDEEWKPAYPPGTYNSKFEKAARACEAILGEPQQVEPEKP